MFAFRQLPTLAAALGLLAGTGVATAQRQATVGELQETILDLREQNKSLQRALAESNKGEKQASEQLAQVRERLEALGKNLLDGGNDRLVQAAADLQLANERTTRLESAVMRLVSTITDYRSKAVVSDPDALLRLETSLRELDDVLGLRQKPRPDVRTGSLQEARVVSLDQESGMLVLNLGETQGAKIGMTFRLSRGQQPYGQAIIADVRKGVSGAFVERLDAPNETPRPGDLAILELQASAQ
ncbi:MAG: hypothetical protein EOP83_08545 [Verrucomicrobiaceae bacterium]|nr:MAG: hypothetical protein EOP83_08545 [Verrucomicrobiaceae bacterium]